VSVSGKTLAELSSYVTDSLRARLNKPEVTVTLRAARMQRVYVLGSVKNPGLYDMKPGWRITEAMAAAGGLLAGTEPADCTATVLRAATRQRETFKLNDVLHGPQDSNVAVESGDVLTIDAQETLPVYVMGRVKNPGIYRLRKDNSKVMEALTLAGGTLEDAALSKVTIAHLTGSSTVVDLVPAVVEGRPEANVALQAGDLITVPEETSRIAVLGFVQQPGFFPLKSGQRITLSEALGMAKGTDNKRGGIGQVAVIRTRNGKQEKLVFDVQKFFKTGDVTQNPQVEPGDVIYVPETRKADWDNVWRAISSLGILINPLF
jgi:polysaccharide export outer membrane protein